MRLLIPGWSALAGVSLAACLPGTAPVSTTADASAPVDATRDATDAARGDATDGATGDGRVDAADARDSSDGDANATDATDATDGGGPDGATIAELISLSAAPLTLTPAFSPSVHDYYVRCAAGVNALDIAMVASPGATVGVIQPAAFASAGQAHVAVSLNENDAVVAIASLGASTASYWVRCLPHDFPVLSMTTRANAAPPPDGYYLVGDVLFASGESGYAMALDARGVPVWYHAAPSGAANVDSLAPNTLSFLPYLPYTFTDFSGSYEILGLSPYTEKSVTPNMAPLDLHELQVLPNGDTLVFTWPITTGVDLTGLSTYGANEDMIGCDIQEQNPAGETVWSWSATDHLDPVKDCTYPFVEVVKDTTGTAQNVVDPFHCNSIDVDSNGDLLVSARHLDSVFLVSKATGKILWKMGGASYTKDGAPFLQLTGDSMGGFFRQHDARSLSPSSISLFDDQSGKAGPARALEITYDVTAGTASIAWQYLGTQSSLAMGSFRILPDGSRIVGWGWITGNIPTFTEVDATGLALRDFTFPDGDVSYRAIKVPLSELDLGLLRAAAGATN